MPDKEKIYVLAYAPKQYPEAFTKEYERQGGGKQVLSREYDPVFIKVEKGGWYSALDQVPEGSNIMFMDHSGTMLFGIDDHVFIENLAKKKPKTCYAGSCFSLGYAPLFKKLSPKTKYVGDEDYWKGFDISRKGDEAIIKSESSTYTNDYAEESGGESGLPQGSRVIMDPSGGGDLIVDRDGNVIGMIPMEQSYAPDQYSPPVDTTRQSPEGMQYGGRINRMQDGNTVEKRKLQPEQAEQWWAELDAYAQQYGQDAFKKHYPEVFQWYYDNSPSLSNKTIVDDQSNETGRVMGAVAELAGEVESIPQALVTSAVTGEWDVGKIIGSAAGGQQHYPSDYIENRTLGTIVDVLGDPALAAGLGAVAVKGAKKLLTKGARKSLTDSTAKLNATGEGVAPIVSADKRPPKSLSDIEGGEVDDFTEFLAKLEQRKAVEEGGDRLIRMNNEIIKLPEYRRRSTEMGLPPSRPYKEGIDIDDALDSRGLHRSGVFNDELFGKDAWKKLEGIDKQIAQMGEDVFKKKHPDDYRFYEKYDGIRDEVAWRAVDDVLRTVDRADIKRMARGKDKTADTVKFWLSNKDKYSSKKNIPFYEIYGEGKIPDGEITIRTVGGRDRIPRTRREMESTIVHELGHDNDYGVYAYWKRDKKGHLRYDLYHDDQGVLRRKFTHKELPDKYEEGLLSPDEIDKLPLTDHLKKYAKTYRQPHEVNQKIKEVRYLLGKNENNWYDDVHPKELLDLAKKDKTMREILNNFGGILNKSWLKKSKYLDDESIKSLNQNQVAAMWLSRQLGNWRVVAPAIPAGVGLNELKEMYGDRTPRAQYGGRVIPKVRTVFESEL